MIALFRLAILFTLLSFTQLMLIRAVLEPVALLAPLVLTGCGSTALFIMKRQQATDTILLPLTLLLSGLGLVFTYRLAPNFLDRQLIWLMLATLILLIIILTPSVLQWLRNYKYAWLISGLTLLATTLVLGVNPSGYGARLWLQFGPVYVQPSEPLKLLLVVFLAAYMADRHRQLTIGRAYIGPVLLPRLSYWGPMLFMWGLSMILLIWQRDLGAALLFFGTFLGMVYLATGQSRYVWTGLLLLVIASTVGYYLFDVVRLRFEAYLNPWLDASGRSFQIVQSLLAFASGGFFGQGLGQGLPTAIPVVHTDFVYAAIGEEYGLAGALAVLLCFMLLISQAMRIALEARSRFEQLLASGIALMFGLQTLVITAGTLKLMPLTGVTLPFVSYGGSSLITSFAMIGLLIRISGNKTDRRNRSNAPFAPYQLRLTTALLTGFLIVAGGLILWQIVLRGVLIERDDNPRPIIANQKVKRGAIHAANGTLLVESLLDENGFARRRYYYPALAPITGYFSQRYGSSGVETVFDSTLRGNENRSAEAEAVDELLHRQQFGQPITLTIDLPIQLAVETGLKGHEGAVVILEIESGAVIALSSQPTYNPNLVDQQWDLLREDSRSPLLNRAAQGLFPVGDLARFIGLIGLQESGATIPISPTIGSLSGLLGPLGETGYNGTAHQLGFTRGLSYFDSQVSQLPNFSEQGSYRDLTVTPLHLAQVVAALENDGDLIQPRLSMSSAAGSRFAFKPETADFVRRQLKNVAPQVVGWAGQATPEETGQPTYLSWFIGLAPTRAPQVEPLPIPDLIFDPSLIPTESQPLATPTANSPKAKYAIVTVIVMDQPQLELAQTMAVKALQPLLREP